MVKGKESPRDLGDSAGAKAEAYIEERKKTVPLLAHDVNDFNIVRTEDISTTDDVDFKSLLLPDFILNGLTAANFHRPSPIQLRSVPLVRLGFDLIVQSKAGTGKTLIIALAALESVKIECKRLQAIVVAPTREIALQTKNFISIISSDIAVKTEAFIGGTSVKEDKRNTLGCQIAIGTPGRLNSLIESGDMSLNHVRLLVLDEADKLMEKSIFSQIRSISKALPENKQTILCSATFLHPVKDYVVKHMKEPFWVTPEKAVRFHPNNLEHQTSTSTVLLGVTQFFKEVPNHAQIIRKLKFKLEEILEILSGHPFTQCIIFSNYQTRAETICHQLVSNGWPAMSVRGQDDQSHRTATLNSFKELQSRVLLTTDVMSRGVDFRGVDLVINLDIPYDSATYLHRMGRAGRFGSYGCVITLASTGAEVESFRKILSEVNDILVYTLPSDLTLIKQSHNLKNVFYKSSQLYTGDHVISDNLDTQTETVLGSGLEPESEDLVRNDLSNHCESVVEEDTRENNATGEQIKLISGDAEGQMESPFEGNNKVENNAFIEELKESSAQVKDQNLTTSSRAVNTENRLEMAVQHAAAHLSKVLCTSKRESLIFHSFEDLEQMCSNWMLHDKKCENKSPQPEKNLKFQDWWTSANTILTAANLQLQELKESALKTSDLSQDVTYEMLHSSSEDSVFQCKKSIQKTEKKKSSKKNVKSSSYQNVGFSSHQKGQQDDVTGASQKDASWLWDESSKLYYIWDEDLSCYYLYNPELKCSFKWEPGLNNYYKWDAVSQNYKLWNCESGSYYNARVHSLNEPQFPTGNSDASQSRNKLDQNYLEWFAMWNKQLRQMSMQVYQVEYFQNLFGKFHSF